MAGYDPSQPRDKEGQWTEAGSAARKAAGLSEIVSIGQQKFQDGNLRDPRGDKTILSLASEPVPSKSSQGKWLVMVELKSNLGNGRQSSNIPFWRKSEALEAIKYLKSFNLPEYNWR